MASGMKTKLSGELVTVVSPCTIPKTKPMTCNVPYFGFSILMFSVQAAHPSRAYAFEKRRRQANNHGTPA